MLADRRYCYPLTITDSASRYVFACEALSNGARPDARREDRLEGPVRRAEGVVERHGVPRQLQIFFQNRVSPCRHPEEGLAPGATAKRQRPCSFQQIIIYLLI